MKFTISINLYRQTHLGICNIKYTPTIRKLVKRKLLTRIGTEKKFPGGNGFIQTDLYGYDVPMADLFSLLLETKSEIEKPERENDNEIIFTGVDSTVFEIKITASPEWIDFFEERFYTEWKQEDFDPLFEPIL